MIKLIALDIDGTVLKKDLTISKELKSYIKEITKKNIKVVLATGRMYKAAIHIARELGINTPLICYQGALIRNFYDNDDIIYQINTDKSLGFKIINELREKSIHINLYDNDNLYVEHDNQLIKEYCKDRYIDYKVVKNFEDVECKNLHKILAINYNQNIIEGLIKELNTKYGKELYIVKSTPYFVEISNLEAKKCNAIKYLADKWRINQSEIMAIGDQDNDIDMIEYAKIGIAMGNGTEKIKEKADYVTKTIEEDGIIYAIEKFVK